MLKFFQKNNLPGIFILIFDVVVISISLILSYLLRFNFNIPSNELASLPIVLTSVLLVRLIFSFSFRTHKSIVRHTSTQDIIRVFVTNIFGSICFLIINIITFKFVSGKFLIPFSILILEFMISTFFIWIYRLTIKMAYLEYTNPSRSKQRVIIYGAGEAGLHAKSAIDRDAGLKYKVIAFVDDDPQKHGKKLQGISIFPYEKLDDLLQN
ncbi:MAG: hypothetical protein GX140_07225, partial [Bacteroidales bacterium]|nr:hypothetical protein [Bacteroidales bacterium]